jgi:hypothetical protein
VLVMTSGVPFCTQISSHIVKNVGMLVRCSFLLSREQVSLKSIREDGGQNGPGVYSASNRNEYEIFLWVKRGGTQG